MGDRIARLIGAPAGSVATGDTLSIKVFQALAAALRMRPGRRVILSDSGNFPSDLYMAQGLIDMIDKGYELRTPGPEDVEAAIDRDVAVVMLTHVDYRSGRMHDMDAITRAAQAAGAVMIWDLAHSAGGRARRHRGIGRGIRGRLHLQVSQRRAGGAGLHPRPPRHRSGRGAGAVGMARPCRAVRHGPPPTGRRCRQSGLRVGTPPVVQLALLDAALDVWDGIAMEDLRAASVALSERFISEVEAHCPGLTLASPRDPARRGSQVSFAFEQAYPAMRALIDRGVIGDFRAPDLMRFGFAPLYLDEADVVAAVDMIERVIRGRLWSAPEYQARSRVT